MKTRNVPPRWVLAATLAAFLIVGLICSIAYHDISMLWASLFFAAVAAVIFPVCFVLIAVLHRVCSAIIVAICLLVMAAVRFIKR